jgi:hypothetical protein
MTATIALDPGSAIVGNPDGFVARFAREIDCVCHHNLPDIDGPVSAKPSTKSMNITYCINWIQCNRFLTIEPARRRKMNRDAATYCDISATTQPQPLRISQICTLGGK